MFLDIAVGMIIGVVVAALTGQVNVLMVLFGVFSALAPDIDALIYLVRNGGKVDHHAHEHRELLHRPLFFSGGGAIIVWWFFGTPYALLWFLGTLAHLLHDTFDGGWGIRWLDPFYEGYFTLASYSPKKHIPNLEEQRVIAEKYGNPRWLQESYLKMNVKLATEYAVLAGATGFVVWAFWFR